MTGFNPPGGFGAFGTAGGDLRVCRNRLVSIRRADLGLLELKRGDWAGAEIARFNPPGGFGAFGTRCLDGLGSVRGDVSIRRADLGLLEPKDCRGRTQGKCCFNPPGGFGAFGTIEALSDDDQAALFQSAGRIWGFWNSGQIRSVRNAQACVSIRRADLGLLEPFSGGKDSTALALFQSAGRIWGFWNVATTSGVASNSVSFNPPGGFGAFGTKQPLLKRTMWHRFNPPGGFGAFGTGGSRSGE